MLTIFFRVTKLVLALVLFRWRLNNEVKKTNKQAMITLQGMAEHRFSNEYKDGSSSVPISTVV